MRELRPCENSLPEPDGGLPGGRIDEHRPEQALPVGEEHRRHAVPVGIDHPPVFGEHLVVGGGVGDRRVDEAGVEAEFAEEVLGDGLLMWLVSVDVQRLPGASVPGVQVVHGVAAQQGTDAHHRPAVGPVPFPRVLFAFLTVDLLEAEEAPVHGEPGLRAHLADPQRGLIRVGAHDVEVEVDGCGCVRHIVNLRLRAARSPSSASPLQLIAPESIAC